MCDCQAEFGDLAEIHFVGIAVILVVRILCANCLNCSVFFLCVT